MKNLLTYEKIMQIFSGLLNSRIEVDDLKAPVKAGKECEVQVLYVIVSSDQPWTRAMRRRIMRHGKALVGGT